MIAVTLFLGLPFSAFPGTTIFIDKYVHSYIDIYCSHIFKSCSHTWINVCCCAAGVLSFAPSSASAAAQGTVLIELSAEDTEYIAVEEQLQGSIREHKDNCGGIYSRFHINKVRQLLAESMAETG